MSLRRNFYTAGSLHRTKQRIFRDSILIAFACLAANVISDLMQSQAT